MRILHIDKLLPPSGGVGSYIEHLSCLQRSRGHEVLNFGCVKGGDGKGMPVYEDFALAGPAALPRMIHSTAAKKSLVRFLNENPADIAHLHNIYHHLTPSILPVLSEMRIPTVMTVHDYRLACPTKHFLRPSGVCTLCVPNKFWHAASPRCAGVKGLALMAESFVQRAFRRYFKWIDLFLCPTEMMLEVMGRIGVPSDKLRLHRLVVPPLPLPEDVSRDPRTLLFAGRCSSEKSPQLMVELARRMPEIKVVIAGDGPMTPMLKIEIIRSGLKNVTLAGNLSRGELAEQVQRCTAFVLTSRWMENSPLAMLEAMACGRCVIAPDHRPIREWITDGKTGALFTTEDVSSLEQAARKVIGDAAGRKSMEKAARELVASRHEPSMLMAQLEQFYEEAAGRCALR